MAFIKIILRALREDQNNNHATQGYQTLRHFSLNLICLQIVERFREFLEDDPRQTPLQIETELQLKSKVSSTILSLESLRAGGICKEHRHNTHPLCISYTVNYTPYNFLGDNGDNNNKILILLWWTVLCCDVYKYTLELQKCAVSCLCKIDCRMNNGTREDRLLSISKYLPQQSSKLLSVIPVASTRRVCVPSCPLFTQTSPLIGMVGDINRITDDGNTEAHQKYKHKWHWGSIIVSKLQQKQSEAPSR